MLTTRRMAITGAVGILIAAPFVATPAFAAPTPIDPWVTLTAAGSTADSTAGDLLGNVYILDSGAHRVVKYGPDRTIVATYPLPAGSTPLGIGVDIRGDAFVPDTTSGDVIRIPAGGSLEATWSTLPSGTKAFDVRPDGRVFALTTTNVVYEIGADGTANAVFTPPFTANDVAVEATGDIYVSTRNGRVVSHTVAGATTTEVVAEGQNLTDIDVLSSGSWAVLEPGTDTLHGHAGDGATFARPLGGDVDHFTLDGSGASYYILKGSTELRSIPLAGGTPSVVATMTTSGTVADITTTADQTLLVAWGANPTVSAVPLTPRITSAPLNITATVDTPLTATITASGGLDPVAITSTNLPAWLQLSTTGTLSGTPTSPGTYVFDVIATNSLSPSTPLPPTPQTQTIVVEPAIVPTPTPTPDVPTGSGGGTSPQGAAGSSPASTGPAGNPRVLASTGGQALPFGMVAGGLLLAGVAAGVVGQRRRHGA